MSNTYRKTDTSHADYIDDKRIKKIDKKHQKLIVTDGSISNYLIYDGSLLEDPKMKKFIKKNTSHKKRALNHKAEKEIDIDD